MHLLLAIAEFYDNKQVMPKPILFKRQSIDFLNLASKQKNPEWLEKNRQDYETLLVQPMQELMLTVSKNLKKEAPQYQFPTRNFARIRRIDRSQGQTAFKSYIHASVTKPSESRFESLPNLYLHISDGDYYTAGGAFSPSAKHTKHIRSWIANDASLLEKLLSDGEFKKRFPKLGTERMLKTKPRDYSVDHPKFEWLKLSAWYVWRPLTQKVVLSSALADVVTEDWRQILRLNRIIDLYTSSWPTQTLEVNVLESMKKVKLPKADF